MNIIIYPWEKIPALLGKKAISLDTGYAPRVVATIGELPQRRRKLASLLLSRMPLRVNAGALWLKSVKQALNYCRNKKYTVVTSSGMLGWDYITWMAGRLKCRIFVILTAKPINTVQTEVDLIRSELHLDDINASFLIPVVSDFGDKEFRMKQRDNLVFALSDVRFPIALRINSFWMTKIMESVDISLSFGVPYPKQTALPWCKNKKWINGKIEFESDKYLFHWTRGTYGPWKGETTGDYFHALNCCTHGNPRDAFATLQYIAESGILRGEGKMIRGGEPVVSFTEVDPFNFFKEVTYRSSLKHWQYEPYGIAIKKSALTALKTRQVRYGKDDDYIQLDDSHKGFFQFEGGSDHHDWKTEKEWRLIGDLDLQSVKEDIIIITPFEAEAVLLRKRIKYEVMSLEKGV